MFTTCSVIDSSAIKSGQRFGANYGNYFEDFKSPHYIRGMICYYGGSLLGCKFLYSSPDKPENILPSKIHGNITRSIRNVEFRLNVSEKINKVQVAVGRASWEDIHIQGIRFFTTNGRSSHSIDYGEQVLTEKFDGYTLGYINGTAGERLNQLQFHWYKED